MKNLKKHPKRHFSCRLQNEALVLHLFYFQKEYNQGTFGQTIGDKTVQLSGMTSGCHHPHMMVEVADPSNPQMSGYTAVSNELVVPQKNTSLTIMEKLSYVKRHIEVQDRAYSEDIYPSTDFAHFCYLRDLMEDLYQKEDRLSKRDRQEIHNLSNQMMRSI